MKQFFVVQGTVIALLFSVITQANCARFTDSTLYANSIDPNLWRTDYPATSQQVSFPWLDIDFAQHPEQYMYAILEDVRTDFSRSDNEARLVGTGTEDWWISLWLDYAEFGREPLMSLTKERGPDEGDLSPSNIDGYQVWAVGFYNSPGASVLGSIFEDPCDPSFPTSVNFPEGTVSIKFLFTDASVTEVEYLLGGPTYQAYIDPEGSSSDRLPPSQRQPRILRLLQVDIAAKDTDAASTQWVFGTFAWMGPRVGDGLFDNLVPVSLQWGNDPLVYDEELSESWINTDLRGHLYGWPQRPHLGFNGRANGPADNIRSSCLSCHAAARAAPSNLGILGFRFNMSTDLSVPQRVRAHVDTWFQNLPSGQFFDPQSENPTVSALDYSLQLHFAVRLMCRACNEGALTGDAPAICLAARPDTSNTCGSQSASIFDDFTTPPRQ